MLGGAGYWAGPASAGKEALGVGRDVQETMDWVTEWRSVTDEVVVMTAPPGVVCVCVCVCVNHVRGVHSYDLRDDVNTNAHTNAHRQTLTETDRQTDRHSWLIDQLQSQINRLKTSLKIIFVQRACRTFSNILDLTA